MTVFNIQSSSSIPIKWSLSNVIPVLKSYAKKNMAVNALAFGYDFE